MTANTDARVASRELDREVAIRVMRLPQREGWRGGGEIIKGDPIWLNAAGAPVTCPCYSADIAAAWEVVEAMESRGWRVVYRSTGPREGWRRAEVHVPHYHGEHLFTADAATAPLAICLAALAATASTRDAPSVPATPETT